MKIRNTFLHLTIITLSLHALQVQAAIPKLDWMKNVSAKTYPKSTKTYIANNFGALGDAIQKAIDECAAKGGGKVTEGTNAGSIVWVKDWTFENFSVKGVDQKELSLKNNTNVTIK